MRARWSFVPVLLFLLVVVASCLRGTPPHEAHPPRTLSLGSADPEAAAREGSLGVVFAGPRGETVDPSEVTVVFNRPMRALELAGDESAPPASIVVAGTNASPKGSWRWMGTSALVFAPEARLPRATTYVVNVPAGVRALDGSALDKAYSFELSTARPKLVRVEPADDSRHLVPTTTFELRFNQGVDDREVERAVSLSSGEGAARATYPFRAKHPKSDVPGLVKLTPLAPLPLATDFTLEAAADLKGTEGPLPLGSASETTVSTYGALEVKDLSCSRPSPQDKCDARGGVGVNLSNRVPFASWKAHVRVEAPRGGARPVPRFSAWSDGDALRNWVDVDAPFEPARAYAVVVTAGLRDEYGQTLAHDVRLPFETDDLPPQLTIGVQGAVYEAAGGNGPKGRDREVPIGTVNFGSFELATAALDEAQVAALAVHDDESSEHLFRRASEIDGANVETVRPQAAANVTAVHVVKLDDVLAKRGGHGAVVVAVQGTEGSKHADTRLLAVTNLGLSAKVSPHGSVVWVTHVSDGSPVARAQVSVRSDRSVLATVTTDADGIATISADQYTPRGSASDGSGDPGTVLIARAGDDWTWRKVGDTLEGGVWTWSDHSGRAPYGMLFTDRGIYKTGDTVQVRGIFRTPVPRGTQTPKGATVTLVATDAENETLFKESTVLDAFGAFATPVPLPASARLGTLSFRATIDAHDDVPEGSASASAEIATYRPAEFKVGVEPERPSYVRGDTAAFSTRADYLFGAPMTGGDVRYTVTRGPTWFTPPGTEGFVTDDLAYTWDRYDESPRAGEIASGDGALDDRGAFATKTVLALPHQHGPEVVSLEAEVTDVSRQTIAGRASVVVHPAQFYVALAGPTDLFVDKGATVQPKVLAVKPTGERVAGAAVKVELVRRTWRSAWEASGEQAHAHSTFVETTLASCDVRTAAEPVSCDLVPGQPGFFVLRATARDARGSAATASTSLYVLGDGEVGWRYDERADLELVTDKKQYEVGDVARVLVKNPFPEAEALVTVQRDGVYKQSRVHMVGPMPTVTVPITDELRPNVSVAVHLIRGRTKDAPPSGADVGAPAFRVGSASLSINPESRRLKVAITPAKRDLRPGEDLDADVVVHDRAGHPATAEVTFYAVDEGVLMLTGYKTPDPIPELTHARWGDVLSIESRADLARVFLHANGVGLDKGSEGGGGGGMRADFRSTAFFEPAILTDAEGRAHVHFKVPDSLTTYRLMAVAVAEDDRFGFGEAQAVVSRPLMVRPNLPRFLRAGDEIEAGAVLSAKGLGATQVEVALEATGLEVVGDAKRTVSLPEKGSVEVRWTMRAPRAAKATFAFRATAGNERDAVQVTRDVQAPLAEEAVALYGETSDAATENLGDLSAMRPDVGGLDLRLTSSALVGLDDGVEQLLDYPYGCTEQLSSRLVPLVPLRQLAADYGLHLPSDLAAVIDDTVAKIVRNQHDDGGFGWWPDSRRSDPWVSAYATWTLDLARKGGAHVPDDAIEGGARYLRGKLEELFNAEGTSRASAAFFVDVLASIGSPDAGFTSHLYDQRDKLPLFARALLAHAMAVSKMDAKQARELLRDLEAHLRVTPTGATVAENLGDEYAVILDSEARTTAIVLRALLALDASHPLAARLAKGLLGARQHGSWRDTHETAWALLALDDYRRAQEKDSPDFDAKVLFGGALAAQAPFHEKTLKGSSAHIAAEALTAQPAGAPLSFQVAGSGKLFYEARLRYARRDLPAKPIDRGFYVRKLVRSVRPGALRDALATLPATSATTATAGDLVLVDLVVVTADPHEQVVVDDPLPAGLEAVDARLATTAQSLDVTDAGGAGDEADEDSRSDDGVASDSAWARSWYHREYHDDRVLTFVDHMAAGMYHYRYLARATTHGTFVVPPTKAECMYEPETFGRTAGSTFVVRAK